MPNDDTSLDIAIKTTADTSGAQQATDAAKKLQAVFESTANMPPIPTPPGADPKDTQNLEKHNKGLREMHKLFHGLNEIVPGLGIAMQAVFSPVGAAITAAMFVLRAFSEHIKSLDEATNKLNEQTAKPWLNTLEAQREGLVHAATAAAEFKDRLADAARAQQTVKEKTEEAAAAVKLQITESGRLDDALKSAEQTQLEFQHGAGLISDAQYYEQKLALEEKYAERKRALEEREAMAEIMAHRRGLETAEAQQADLEKNAKAARAKADAAQVKVDTMPTLDAVTKRAEDAKKAVQDLEKKYPQATAAWATQPGLTPEKLGALGFGINVPETSGFATMAGAMGTLKEWLAKSRVATTAGAAAKAYPGQYGAAKAEAGSAEREAARQEKQAEEGRQYLTEGARQQAIRQAQFDAHKQTDQDLNTMGRQEVTTKAALTQPLGQTIGLAAAGEDALQHGRRLDAKHQAAIQQLGHLLGAHNMNVQAILDLLGRNAHDTAALTAQIQQLEKKLQHVQRSTYIP